MLFSWPTNVSETEKLSHIFAHLCDFYLFTNKTLLGDSVRQILSQLGCIHNRKIYGIIQAFFVFQKPWVLWCCWLGGRKGIRPVKTEWWGAGMVICLERGADLHMAQVMPLPLTVSVKSRLVWPFWYRLTRVVPDKGPLNGCKLDSILVTQPMVSWN